ncbi:hypothetical protein TRFO_27287 [Tritrichomonas foetus]|uniref:Gamma tubulin complex component C-terminal domain-containing protein n=1 Tax=Tritrichomonas foetus TaxID=1144522 RepID=A0A1J4K1J3_9EUKA|nr:hypothetical protein TRFO_27287 [Tritrichomonas foetus]|eukprot:OHT05107.1 hypothetical protein TRFO_27287 [Tritrichomonas foetus]
MMISKSLTKEPHLSIYLNQVTPLKIEIVPEEFLVESIRSLYFHLSSSVFIKEENGKFSLFKNVGTFDHTPNALQSVLKPALKAASDLYDIKSFVTRVARSSLQSVLQEAVQQNIITPFYQSLEKNKTDKLLIFLFKMRPVFADLNSALELVNSPKPIEIAFARAKAGSEVMMNISIMCLHLFADLCREVINVHNSSVLTAQDFFIQIDEKNMVNVVDLPSAVPKEFADDIARAATSLLIKAPPMKLDIPTGDQTNSNLLPYQIPQNMLSFELLLPEEVPIAETPNEAISNFRAAAWSITIPKPVDTKPSVEKYSSLHEAVSNILLKPLWDQAKQSQKELVQYVLKDQNLLDVIEMLAALYLMKRGDIHVNYINGYYRFDQGTVLFQRDLKNVPYFEYRFIPPNIIAVVIPSSLRRIITAAQLKVYLKYYQWILKMRTLQYQLSTMEYGKKTAELRMQLIQFFLSLYQITFTAIEAGLFKLKNEFSESKKFEDLIDAHKRFIDYISIAILTDHENISSEITAIFDFAQNFCDHANEMNADEINQNTQQFISFKTFLNALLTVPAKKNPSGMAATLLNAM